MTEESLIDAQSNIIAKKYFYQTTASIMSDLEEKGYPNFADETIKVISAYRDIVSKKNKNNGFSNDYNHAFKKIDEAIESVAYKVFYQQYEKKFNYAYQSFENFDHVNAILTRQHIKNGAL